MEKMTVPAALPAPSKKPHYTAALAKLGVKTSLAVPWEPAVVGCLCSTCLHKS